MRLALEGSVRRERRESRGIARGISGVTPAGAFRDDGFIKQVDERLPARLLDGERQRAAVAEMLVCAVGDEQTELGVHTQFLPEHSCSELRTCIPGGISGSHGKAVHEDERIECDFLIPRDEHPLCAGRDAIADCEPVVMRPVFRIGVDVQKVVVHEVDQIQFRGNGIVVRLQCEVRRVYECEQVVPLRQRAVLELNWRRRIRRDDVPIR